MSHFTKVQTKIFDKGILISVLKKLGHAVDERNTTLKGYQDNKTKVDIRLNLKSSYDIGFNKSNDGSYQVVADWWGVKGINENDFLRDLKQNYSLEIIHREMKKKGYKIVEQKNLQDNSIKVVVRKW